MQLIYYRMHPNFYVEIHCTISYEQSILHYIESTKCIELVVYGEGGHVVPPVMDSPCEDLGFVACTQQT